MCGICGELTFEAGATVDPVTLAAMRDRLSHRGPDADGLFVGEDGRIGLGFRRLRIIDLSSAANQPLCNEDGSVRVVFNGEIYNYQTLRARLLSNGHQFRSRSDTEVLVHLYEEVGERFVDEIDGMFAIGLWDARRRRLLLARDRTGKKPLFYYQDRHRLVFGSEIKALFAHGAVPVDVDETQIPRYFTFGYVPHPATFYRGIRQIDPATVLVAAADGRIESRRYWQLRFRDPAETSSVDRRVARDRVRQLVTEAVSRRTVSDVPIGAFLSAGIDSTIVVGVLSRLSDRPVRTFTIGFEDAPAFDETAAARKVAERFGTEHTEFRVKPSAVQLIDRLIWHHDGPFGDSSAIPTFLVSELTRPHATVVLTGDGGDDVFAGYLRFRAALAADWMPRAVGPALNALLTLLPKAPHERHWLARARRFMRFAHLPPADRLARWTSVFQEDLASLLPDGAPADDVARAAGSLDAGGGSRLGALLAANFSSYLPDDLLVKADRCTMANSIEARCPLLDTALVEYAASLPDSFKVSGGQGKAILREAFADLIPRDIDRRPKTGFGVPLDAWFRGELREFVRDTLLSRSAALRTYIRPDGLERLIDAHQRGRANVGHRLWTLVCFERWLQQLPVWTARQGSGTMRPPVRP